MRCYSLFSASLPRLFLVALLLTLAGCASMSEDECRTANWSDIGMRDGQNGAPRATFGSHVKACREIGVIADQQSYMRAWDRGIVSFCTPQNGLEMGRRGRSYANGTCPAELEPGFRFRYERGYDVYRAQQEIDRVNFQLRDKQHKLDETRDDGVRRTLRQQMRDLDFDMRRARDRLYDAERRAQAY